MNRTNTASITKTPSRRNSKGEQEHAQLSFYDSLISVHEQRNRGEMIEVWQVAQSLIVCGLPYDQVEDTIWERTARLGDGSMLTVTFSASQKGVPLPYGQDRGPLYYMFNRAFEQYQAISRSLPKDMDPEERARLCERARFVEWDIAADYMKAMGKGVSGKDYKVLAERLKRISSCNISIVRTNSSIRETSNTSIIGKSRMPAWAADKSDKKKNLKVVAMSSKAEGPCGFAISPDYFNDFITHHVPVPAEVIRKLLRRPKYLDLFAFLCWRSFAAESVSYIPLKTLQEQIGSSDKTQRRLAKDLQEIINYSKKFGWKELNAEVTYDERGRRVLKIGKPINNIHFLAVANDKDGD